MRKHIRLTPGTGRFLLIAACAFTLLPTGAWAWSLAAISSNGNILAFDYSPASGFTLAPGGTRAAGSAPIDVSVGKASGGNDVEIVVLRDGGAGNDMIDVYRFAGGQWTLVASGNCGVTDAKAIGVTMTHLGTETPIIAVLIDNGADADTFAGFEVSGSGLAVVQEPAAFGGSFAGDYSGFSAGQIEQIGAGPPMGGDPEKLNVAFGRILPDGRNAITYAQFRPLHISPVYLTPRGDRTDPAEAIGATSLDFGNFGEYPADPPDYIVGAGGNYAENIVAWWTVPQGKGDQGAMGRNDVGEPVIDVTGMNLDADALDEIAYLTAGKIGTLIPTGQEGPMDVGPSTVNVYQIIKIDGIRAGERGVSSVDNWERLRY
jgi:hypothetical protein